MFRIPVEIPLSNLEITYHDRVMTLGSCFAEIIGKRMNVACFLTEINPFGVLL